MSELEKTTLNRYTIQFRLAKGGMSSVYLAHDEQQRTVVIKVVDGDNPEYVARFQHEIAALKTLKHTHILPIIDDGEYDSWHYYVMPYAGDGNLLEHLDKGPLSQEEAGDILKQVASSLQFAHDRGILHRDIKASNILLKAREHGYHAYLADFGLAIGVDECVGLTQTGSLIGTPEYMAPELAEAPATMSSDIYALGVLLYQMLTGRVPFKGSTSLSIYCKHIAELPTPPSHLNPAISLQVEAVILRALAKRPQDRFKTATEMAEIYSKALHAAEKAEATSLYNAFDGVELAAPTLRVIPVAPVGRPHRRIYQASFVLAAVFFLLIVPLALGFSLSFHPNGVALHGSLAQGASTEFVAQPRIGASFKPASTKNLNTNMNDNFNQPTGNGQGDSDGHKNKHKHED